MTDRARQRDSDPISTGDPGAPADAPRRRRPIAFGVHQLFEYFLAVALVVLSVHIGHSDLLVAGGAIFGLLAVTARGPLGLVRICGPRLHAVLDVAAAVLLAGAPLVRPLRPGVLGIVVIELVAVAWLRVTMLTRYTSRARSVATDPVATTPSPSVNGDQEGADTTPGSTLSAMRGLGRMTAGARNRIPEAKTTLDSGARQMGAHAGRLQRAWRRATR